MNRCPTQPLSRAPTLKSESLALWGVVGYGEGTLTLNPEGMAAIETDMDLRMAAVGGRSVLVEAPAAGGLELSVTSDAMVVQTSSDEVRGSAGSLAASEAEVTRLRLPRKTPAT